MKIPKDLHGRRLADHLIRRWDFIELRQRGSHLQLRTESPRGYTLSVPAHKPMRAGTLRGILTAVATLKGVEPELLLDRLR